MISNIEEVKARQSPVIALATEGDLQIRSVADDVIYVPRVHPLLQPIISTIPLQLFAYYVGVKRGLNVDRPRNLAKSVTVEQLFFCGNFATCSLLPRFLRSLRSVRKRRDLNPRLGYPNTGFRNQYIQPLCHASGVRDILTLLIFSH